MNSIIQLMVHQLQVHIISLVHMIQEQLLVVHNLNISINQHKFITIIEYMVVLIKLNLSIFLLLKQLEQLFYHSLYHLIILLQKRLQKLNIHSLDTLLNKQINVQLKVILILNNMLVKKPFPLSHIHLLSLLIPLKYVISRYILTIKTILLPLIYKQEFNSNIMLNFIKIKLLKTLDYL